VPALRLAVLSDPPPPFPQADKSALLTADDVTAAVEAMVGSDNALAAALATKLDASQAFTREDAISVVDDLVNGAVGEGEGDTLRGTLDSLQARIETLEDAVEDSCGRHCRAGEFVKTACTETDPTVCEACPQEQFSLGGLPNSCIACKTCVGRVGVLRTAFFSTAVGFAPCRLVLSLMINPLPPLPSSLPTSHRLRNTRCKATEYAMSPCTASTDRACAACGVCGDGTFEKTPCSATQNTDCQARPRAGVLTTASSCGFLSLHLCAHSSLLAAPPPLVCWAVQTCDACDQEGQFLATECSAKADAVCGTCTQCADDEDIAVPCGDKQDTVGLRCSSWLAQT